VPFCNRLARAASSQLAAKSGTGQCGHCGHTGRCVFGAFQGWWRTSPMLTWSAQRIIPGTCWERCHLDIDNDLRHAWIKNSVKRSNRNKPWETMSPRYIEEVDLTWLDPPFLAHPFADAFCHTLPSGAFNVALPCSVWDFALGSRHKLQKWHDGGTLSCFTA